MRALHFQFRSFAALPTGLLLFAAEFCQMAAAVDDVLLQTMAGKIVTGIVDDNSFESTLGNRVYRQQFLSNFRSANPGFVSLATGSSGMPPGAQGFPSTHAVSFDLLPMTIGQVAANLFYWDGSDANGDGLDLADVNFVVPSGVSWDVFDANFNVFAADGRDQLVPGGLIQITSVDNDPFDGVDTGAIHKHLVLQLSDHDANTGTSLAQGVYMISWQARAAGFVTSDPFFFALRTSMVANSVHDVAADWAQANIEMLSSPPGLPGDYNRDGSVDAADYVVWRATQGQTGTGLAADGDGDLEVGRGDYELWRANFGAATATSVSGAFAVPEPATLPMLMTAFAVIGGKGRRRARSRL